MTDSDPTQLVDRVSAASLTDAMRRRYNHRAHILGLVTPTPGRILFGPVVTISYVPVRQDLMDEAKHNFARLFYEAVGAEPAGKVLVMSSNGQSAISLGGGTKLSRLQNHRLAGLLCDARLRDFQELQRYDFATYCKGETSRWGGDVLMPFAANVPVVLNEVTVFPGDHVYADGAAAGVVPRADLETVLLQATRIEESDTESLEKIRKEDPAEILRRGSAEQ